MKPSRIKPSLLRTALCLAVTTLFGVGLATAAPKAAKPPKYPANVGLQLYSVREQLKQDLPGTLAQVRKLGFRDVEIYDLHGQTAAEFAKTLAKAGLRARSMHQSYGRFKDDLPGLVADAKALGVTYAGCAWIPHKDAFDAEEARAAIEVFNKAGQALKEAGVQFFYHLHGYEFAKGADGKTLFDEMLAKTDPAAVAFELDVFWAFHGGADPVALLRAHPGRFPLTHLKDMRKGEPVGLTTGKADKEADVTLGTGQIDIAAIVAETNKSGKVAWHFLEDESKAVLEQLPGSLAYLKGLKKK